MKYRDCDTAEVEDRAVCVACIGEAYLREKVRRDGAMRLCDYCGGTASTTTIDELANEIERAFEDHYRRTVEEPSGYEIAVMKEVGWEREGEPVASMIGAAAHVDEPIAEDTRLVLEERHADFVRDQRGEEGPFDEEAHYVGKEPDDVEYQHMWRDFDNSLKTEARFFGASAEAVLKDVFHGLRQHRSPFGQEVILEAGPGTASTGIYRARAFQSTRSLEDALIRPERDIGPPPSALATAGRMNAHGVAVFYGATNRTLAVSEVRPPVGSHVLVGRFEVLRKIRLLDVDALRSTFVKGSVFDPEYVRRRGRSKFLAKPQRAYRAARDAERRAPRIPGDAGNRGFPGQSFRSRTSRHRLPVGSGSLRRQKRDPVSQGGTCAADAFPGKH